MTATAERTATDRLFDALLYAPIGLLADVQARVFRLAEQGRTVAEDRVRIAKVVGEFAVNQGRAQIERAVARRSEPAPVSDSTAAVKEVSESVGPAGNRQYDAELAEALAISDYDALAASQVVSRLEGLSAEEREAIRRYEAAHRARRTILGKIAQLDESV